MSLRVIGGIALVTLAYLLFLGALTTPQVHGDSGDAIVARIFVFFLIEVCIIGAWLTFPE